MTKPETPILRRKMPELDILRALACFSVIGFHAFPYSFPSPGLHGLQKALIELFKMGWLGVNFFFVLSGFLISGILIDSKEDAQYYRNFYIRRALRILPVFYLVLIVLAFQRGQNPWYLFLSFLYMANMAPLLGMHISYSMFWSLAAEEHFYVVWPFFVRNLTRRLLLFCSLAIIVVVPILRAFAFNPVTHNAVLTYTWMIADSFAFGAVLAIFLRTPNLARKSFLWFVTGALAFGATMLAVGAPFGILYRERFWGTTLEFTAINLVFMASIGFTMLIATSKWKALVNLPILRFFGDISYGLYLIHWMVFLWYDALVKAYFPRLIALPGHFDLIMLRFACVFAVATLLAALSRHYVEEPFIRMKDRFTSISERKVAASSIPALTSLQVE